MRLLLIQGLTDQVVVCPQRLGDSQSIELEIAKLSLIVIFIFLVLKCATEYMHSNGIGTELNTQRPVHHSRSYPELGSMRARPRYNACKIHGVLRGRDGVN